MLNSISFFTKIKTFKKLSAETGCEATARFEIVMYLTGSRDNQTSLLIFEK